MGFRKLVGLCAMVFLPEATLAAATSTALFAAPDWPPYFAGSSGFARQLLERCLPEAGLEPKFSPLPVEQVFVALQEGRLDGHVMPRSEERERYVAFGEVPLFEDGYRVVTLAGRAIRFESLSDLDGLRLGHRDGLRYTAEYLSYVRMREGRGVVQAVSTEELLQLLLERRIDAFVALGGTVRHLVEARSRSAPVVVLPKPLSDGPYYLALARRSPRLRDAGAVLDRFDECLSRLKRDGTYEGLARDWRLEP